MNVLVKYYTGSLGKPGMGVKLDVDVDLE